MSAGAHVQWSPVETNLHTTCREIICFSTKQKPSNILQQTAL